MRSTIPIGEIRVRTRHRRDLGDLSALRASLEAIGLLHPIVITESHRLVAGERRLQAARDLGWSSVPVRVVSTLDEAVDLLIAERDENTCRKDFMPSEAVALARDLEPLERKAARARAARHGGRPSESTGKFPAVSKARAKDKTAAAVGVDRKTLAKAEAVVAAADADPRFAPLVEQMDRTGNVHGAYKQLEKRRQADAIALEPPPLPTGPFRVIVADPPWRYDVRAADVTHRANVPYPEMATVDICAMPVRELAAPDCCLWLWTTNAHMRDSFDVLEAWGFTPKTILTWAKQRIGAGHWLRGQTEHCHLAIRGNPIVDLTNQSTLLVADAGEHSAKPETFSLCPGSKVELFARRAREGWIAHGSDPVLSDAGILSR
jgi:N6-adenosine-specific RNA methylase IME4/ParB-like chromosome segregation protein Spo0J